MIFVPRLLSRRNKRKTSKKQEKKRSKKIVTSKKRKLNGNYKIIKSRRKRNDGGVQKKEEEKWVIYSLEGCPYCDEASKLLNKNHKNVVSIVFEKLKKEDQEKVENMIRASDPSFKMTFPRIFKIKGNEKKFIGGYTTLSKIMF